MSDPSLYVPFVDRVRLAREAGEIERAHCFPHLMRYSVGHHTSGVVTLIALCWMEDHGGLLPRAELLLRALVHDWAERVTGDIPSSIKALLYDEEGYSVLGQAELTFTQTLLGVDPPHLTDEERWYLATADRLELTLWATEEYHRGNKRFRSWAIAYCDRYLDFKHPRYTEPPPSMGRLFKKVLEHRWEAANDHLANFAAGLDRSASYDR